MLLYLPGYETELRNYEYCVSTGKDGAQTEFTIPEHGTRHQGFRYKKQSETYARILSDIFVK